MNKDINKNLNDTIKDTKVADEARPNMLGLASQQMSYTKTHKLITALYMVTDIMDKEEPIRNKLRTLGVEILSDTISIKRFEIAKNVQGVLYLLDIISTMNMVSEMNKNILTSEFIKLKNSIVLPQDNHVWLEEFLQDSPLEGWPGAGVDKFIPPSPKGYSSRGELNSKGHTRIGVQKGSTLMKALSDKITDVRRQEFGRPTSVGSRAHDFDLLKKQRRDSIISIIKGIGGNATIKDIRIKMNNGTQGLVSLGEKTLQRELVSMNKDGLLNRTGEKRWTMYSLLAS